jgi:DNA-binding MarR family transcriptional regulator
MATRIIAASDTVMRWYARDFRPGHTPEDLTGTQFAILGLALENPEINLSQIAERLQVSVPTVVRAVDALERKLLVRRERPSMQQRDLVVAITPEGEETYREVDRMRYQRLMELLDRMAPEDVAALAQGYDGMARAVETQTT